MKIKLFATLLTALLITLNSNVNAADIQVPADHSTIQAAVDASITGDTIYIAAGVYQEQIRIIGKSISLIGEPGTIIRAFPDMEPAYEEEEITRRAVALILRCTSVTFQNLAFEGDQLGDQQESTFNGALFLDSGGVIEDCYFSGFRESIPGQRHCEAVEVLNDLPDAVRLEMRIARNTVVDSYSGIRILGSRAGTSLDITVADNVVRGVGPSTALSDLEGIEVQEGVVGEVVRNQVSGFSYVGDGMDRVAVNLAFGILALSSGFPSDLVPLEPLRFEDNILTDIQIHLALSRGNDNVIAGNRFEGAGAGVRPVGLWITGEQIVVENNEFINLEEGIRIAGEDPDFGTVLGMANDASLIGNTFRNVSTLVNRQPQSTDTEEGTLIAPFPGPELDISKSVRLSWPGYYDGNYVLESAPAAEGPWNPLEAELSMENGSLTTYVSAEEAYLFFRLSTSQQ